jgi:hypothetical protein
VLNHNKKKGDESLHFVYKKKFLLKLMYFNKKPFPQIYLNTDLDVLIQHVNPFIRKSVKKFNFILFNKY